MSIWVWLFLLAPIPGGYLLLCAKDVILGTPERDDLQPRLGGGRRG